MNREILFCMRYLAPGDPGPGLANGDYHDPDRAGWRTPHAVSGVVVGPRTVRRRDRAYRIVTRMLAVMLVPVAFVVAPGRARHLACQWALAARFPAEDLTGLTPATRVAFEAARGRALWRDGELIGLTSGYREAKEQARLFAETVIRVGSPAAARVWTLPPHESRHVAGTALDVRPAEGARWLELHGQRHGLYRIYDNEWWHFEYWPDSPPQRFPDPLAEHLWRREIGGHEQPDNVHHHLCHG